ncbi:ABC transporter permease [Cellulomonas humilata]|uniref:Thiamine transport system permease protein n=1 Tax=Cellulomonas humilata TaxID=144055 RepID=A0ABU0EJI9_9CELL|nr:iron ABC transporter permease [Cellulomonas humilata]MDQ0375448.1 thiamine transport system permease protein [Cellulomonas humilata]
MSVSTLTRPDVAAASGRGRVVVFWSAAVALPLIFLGVFFAWPVAVMIAKGFVVDGQLDLSGFADVFSRPRTWRIVGLTVAQATLGTALSVLLGVPGAYVLYRHTFRGRTFLRAFVTVPFVLPTVVVGVAFRSLLVSGGPLGFLHLDGTFAAIVAALVFFNYAVVVRAVGGLWERLDPRAEQAARALGASPWRAFVTVTLPQLTPAIASAASLAFLFCATAFGTVLVLGGLQFGTIETEIWIQTTQFLDLRAAAVLSVVQLVVVAGTLIVAGRARSRREQALGLTLPSASVRPLRLRRPAGMPTGDGHALTLVATAVTALVVLLLALPLVNLVVRSLRTPDGWGLDHYTALGTTGGSLTVTVWQATLNSLRVALDATVIALVVGGLVALVVSRRPRRAVGRRAVAGLDALFMLPLGVSAVTVGFGFLLSMHHPFGLPVDLRTSPLLVPIAQAVVAVPLVVRVVLPVLRAIDPRLREAAATLGATPGRVLRTVDLSIAGRSLGLAVGFAFAASLGEFGATSFLSRPDRPTLPVVIFRLIGRPGAESYGMTLAASVVLAVLTAGIVAACERLRAPGAGGEW